jgi:hypothetical protein
MEQEKGRPGATTSGSETAMGEPRRAEESGGAASKVREFAAGAASRASDAAEALGKRAGSLAETVRRHGPQSGRLRDVATATADRLESGAAYLQARRFENLGQELTATIRRYPIQSMLIGAGLGFILSRRMR